MRVACHMSALPVSQPKLKSKALQCFQGLLFFLLIAPYLTCSINLLTVSKFLKHLSCLSLFVPAPGVFPM